jgi:hypothetical protein
MLAFLLIVIKSNQYRYFLHARLWFSNYLIIAVVPEIFKQLVKTVCMKKLTNYANFTESRWSNPIG